MHATMPKQDKPVTGDEAFARGAKGEGYEAYFWCLVAGDLGEGEANAQADMMQEVDLVADEDVVLAHFQLACWYHAGLHVDRDEARCREHLEAALYGDKVKLDKKLDRAIEQVRERIGLPAKLDLERPLGPAMPNTPGNVHTGQLRGKKLPPLRDKPVRKLPKKPLEPTEDIYGLGFSPDGKWLLSGGVVGELLLWDVATRTVARRCKNASGSCINYIKFSPSGTQALLGSEDSLWVHIFELETNDFILLKGGHKNCAAGVGWVDGAKQVVSADHDGEIRLWDVAKRKVIGKHKSKGIWCLTTSPDGSTFAAGDDKYVVQIYSVPALENLASLPHHGHLIHDLAFDAAGKRLLSASRDDTVGVWDLTSNKLVHQLAHGDTVYAAKFTSPRHVVTGGLDGRLVHWDLDTGARTELAKIDSIHAVQVFGKLVAYGGEGGVKFLEL